MLESTQLQRCVLLGSVQQVWLVKASLLSGWVAVGGAQEGHGVTGASCKDMR